METITVKQPAVKDEIERVRMMVADSGGQTWDLNDNDRAALKRVLSILDLADQTVTHIGRRMQEDPDMGYYCGFGTETFASVARTIAALTGHQIKDVEKALMEDRQPSYRRRDPKVVELERELDGFRAKLGA